MKSAVRRDRKQIRSAIPFGLLVVVLLATLAPAGGPWGHSAAQDTTATECVPPVGDGEPVAKPAASPSPEEELVGEPADEAVAAAAGAAAENLVACRNAGNLSAFLDLVTDKFITNDLAFADRDEAANGLISLLALGALPKLTILELDPGSAQTYDDGRVSVDLIYLQGDYQYIEARWFLVHRGPDLLVDEEVFLQPKLDVDFVTVMSATVADNDSSAVFDQRSEVQATGALILHLSNNGEHARHFQLLQLAEGTALNEDGTLPEDALDGAVAVAGIVVDGGGIEDMALLDLPAGLYALVDLTTGTPVPLTVTEPPEPTPTVPPTPAPTEPPAPTPTAPPTPTASAVSADDLEGTWRGRTSSGGVIEFTVEDGGLVALEGTFGGGGGYAFGVDGTTQLSVYLCPGSSVSTTLQLQDVGELLAPITDGSFAFSWPFLPEATVSGTFESESSASGTLELQGIDCPVQADWTATKS